MQNWWSEEMNPTARGVWRDFRFCQFSVSRNVRVEVVAPSLAVTPPLATYPSRLPFLPLDRICFSAPLGLVTAATLNDAEHVSDHLPLVASLRVDGRAEQPPTS